MRQKDTSHQIRSKTIIKNVKQRQSQRRQLQQQQRVIDVLTQNNSCGPPPPNWPQGNNRPPPPPYGQQAPQRNRVPPPPPFRMPSLANNPTAEELAHAFNQQAQLERNWFNSLPPVGEHTPLQLYGIRPDGSYGLVTVNTPTLLLMRQQFGNLSGFNANLPDGMSAINLPQPSTFYTPPQPPVYVRPVYVPPVYAPPVYAPPVYAPPVVTTYNPNPPPPPPPLPASMQTGTSTQEAITNRYWGPPGYEMAYFNHQARHIVPPDMQTGTSSQPMPLPSSSWQRSVRNVPLTNLLPPNMQTGTSSQPIPMPSSSSWQRSVRNVPLTNLSQPPNMQTGTSSQPSQQQQRRIQKYIPILAAYDRPLPIGGLNLGTNTMYYMPASFNQKTILLPRKLINEYNTVLKELGNVCWRDEPLHQCEIDRLREFYEKCEDYPDWNKDRRAVKKFYKRWREDFGPIPNQDASSSLSESDPEVDRL